MPTHHKDQIATQHFPVGEQIGERGGIERPPARVEKNLRCIRVFGPEIRPVGPYFRHLRWRKTACPLDIVRSHRISVRIFGFPDVIKEDLHSAGTATSFASRQRRSSE
jgi:hypothetical protein